jgi:hypothetical protein
VLPRRGRCSLSSTDHQAVALAPARPPAPPGPRTRPAGSTTRTGIVQRGGEFIECPFNVHSDRCSYTATRPEAPLVHVLSASSASTTIVWGTRVRSSLRVIRVHRARLGADAGRRRARPVSTESARGEGTGVVVFRARVWRERGWSGTAWRDAARRGGCAEATAGGRWIVRLGRPRSPPGGARERLGDGIRCRPWRLVCARRRVARTRGARPRCG